MFEELMKFKKNIIDILKKVNIKEIYIYDARGKSILADYFIIGTAESNIQLEAARNNIIEFMGKHKIYLRNPLEPWDGGWLALDFQDIIIHIMSEELRRFYNIDNLFEAKEFIIEKIA